METAGAIEVVGMTPDELRSHLDRYRLSNAEFACLVGVTARAVHAWLASERKIPGPVVAWFKVVRLLPPKTRAVYFHRLREPQFGERIDEFGMKHEVEQ